MGFSYYHHSGYDGVLAIAVEEVDAGFEKINDDEAGYRISIELLWRRSVQDSDRY